MSAYLADPADVDPWGGDILGHYVLRDETMRAMLQAALDIKARILQRLTPGVVVGLRGPTLMPLVTVIPTAEQDALLKRLDELIRAFAESSEAPMTCQVVTST